MIVIQSFKEMAAMHQAGRASNAAKAGEAAKVPLRDSYFRIVQEITAVLLGLCGYEGDIPEPTAITQQEIDWLLTQSEDIDFMTYLGGNVFICENEADLTQVTGMDMEFAKLHGRWPNCMEAILPLDEAKYLLNADGSSGFALLFSATNNAGGPSWFIPRHLWQVAQIDEQIEANHQVWGVAA